MLSALPGTSLSSKRKISTVGESPRNCTLCQGTSTVETLRLYWQRPEVKFTLLSNSNKKQDGETTVFIATPIGGKFPPNFCQHSEVSRHLKFFLAFCRSCLLVAEEIFQWNSLNFPLCNVKLRNFSCEYERVGNNHNCPWVQSTNLKYMHM